nr:hypothetical protein [Octadecabacter sp. SW4]
MTVDLDKAYSAWFRASVREAQDDPRPATPHAQVMQEAQMLIEKKRSSRSSKGGGIAEERTKQV